jgi:succinyl-diaminopimelate desuccinylase
VIRVDVVELLSRLVSIDTTNHPVKGVRPGRECPEFIRETLSSWGIDSRILDVDGYYTVLGSLGSGKPRVMFQAHFDVVPADPSEWRVTHPFKPVIKDGKMYGRGTADDKGNVAAVMMALKELAAHEEELQGKVLFAFTGDEEIGGANGAGYVARLLEERGELPRFLVNADGGMIIIVRRRAVFNATIEVREDKEIVEGGVGKALFEANTPVYQTRHAAYIMPLVDTHPLVAASHKLRTRMLEAVELRGGFLKSNVVPASVELSYLTEGSEEVEVDHGLTALLRAVVPLVRAPVPTHLYSDYGVSITPNVYLHEDGKHRLVLDIRAMLRSPRPVEEVLGTVIEEALPSAKLEVGGEGLYLYTSPKSTIVKAFTEALGRIGVEPIVAEAAGASDSRYYSPRGVEAVDFGPRGGSIHGPDEYVELDSLRQLVEIYRDVALKLLSS